MLQRLVRNSQCFVHMCKRFQRRAECIRFIIKYKYCCKSGHTRVPRWSIDEPHSFTHAHAWRRARLHGLAHARNTCARSNGQRRSASLRGKPNPAQSAGAVERLVVLYMRACVCGRMDARLYPEAPRSLPTPVQGHEKQEKNNSTPIPLMSDSFNTHKLLS